MTNSSILNFQSSILICGFGGQGVIFAGELLGRAAVHAGLEAAQSASYGAEARGSACDAGVVISSELISYPKVSRPDILVTLSQDAYEKFITIVKPNGRVIFDCDLVRLKSSPHTREDLDQIGYPTTAAATKLGRRGVANVVISAIVAHALGVIDRESLIAAVREQSPDNFMDINIKALDLGWNMTKPPSHQGTK